MLPTDSLTALRRRAPYGLLGAGLVCLSLLLPVSSRARTVYHVDLHLEQGMIDPGIATFVERVIEEAEEAGAEAIVLDIDTFGGRVDAATVIRDAVLDAKPMTIAFVDKRAISAGALISLACTKIVMTQGASIGAATAVDGTTGEKASDKVISYFRAEMRATAERRGRDPRIAEAMVDERVEIPGLSEEAGRPATLTTEQALNWRIADETAESVQELLRIYDLGDAQVVRVGSNWSERVVSFLTHPIVSSILIAVGMFGLIAEVRSPGWGLGGTLALIALALFFGTHYIARLAEWDELLLFLVGLGLLGVEIFAIPGFGLVGLAGILAIVASLVLSQLGDFRLWSLEEFSGVVGRLSLSMIGAIALAAMLLRALPRWAAFNRLILRSQTGSAEGYVAAPTEHDVELVGQEGVALSYLRPVGVGLFSGKRLEIIAEGEFIEAQTPVKIVEARGNRVVVRPL
jgi:membrane-bound serine protease (ClpP class)